MSSGTGPSPRLLLGRRTLVFVTVALAAANPGVRLSAQDDRPAGFVKVQSGTSIAERGGQARALTTGSPIFEGDTLRTGPDGQLGVTLKDETRLALGPNTEIALATFTYAPAEHRLGLVVRLARGLLEFISGRLSKLAPEAVRIETPSSIIGVRGTHLLIGAAQP